MPRCRFRRRSRSRPRFAGVRSSATATNSVPMSSQRHAGVWPGWTPYSPIIVTGTARRSGSLAARPVWDVRSDDAVSEIRPPELRKHSANPQAFANVGYMEFSGCRPLGKGHGLYTRRMIAACVLIAALALCIYALTFRLSWKRRVVIGLAVLVIGSVSFTAWIVRNIDDRPLPGDKPYDPSKQ